MVEKGRLKVQVEFEGAKASFEGDADEVFKAFTRFLTNIYPNLEIVRRLTFTPDLSSLLEELVGFVELAPEGPILNPEVQMSARDKICLALLGADVGSKIGKLSKGTLSSRDLSRITGRARKTIMNEMPKLVARGFVERTSEGEYLITNLGIKHTKDVLRKYREFGG